MEFFGQPRQSKVFSSLLYIRVEGFPNERSCRLAGNRTLAAAPSSDRQVHGEFSGAKAARADLFAMRKSALQFRLGTTSD